MKLYILEPIRAWNCWYDKSFGFVVRAKNEIEARELASEFAGDEGKDAWLNPDQTSCRELEQTGESKVIMRDFAAA